MILKNWTCIMVLMGLASHFGYAQTSVLWGVEGEAWNTNGLLRDFTTDVGYQGTGAVNIPDWPVWTNLTELGAIPDDHISDVDVLREAISNCPPYHAIFLPNGTYTIDEQIILDGSCDNIVIRGESRLGTILYFPKHMNEIKRTLTASDPFITFSGGTNRGIENLSMVLRDEQKGTGYVNRHLPKQNDPHWFYNGENPLQFSGYEKNSWARNLYIKNANHAISVSGSGTDNITILNIVLDKFIGRRSAYDNTEGHMGIQVADAATRCLVHNILFTQNYVHDICPMGTQDSVFSRISGPGVKLDHHAMGNTRNLYTEVDYGDFSGYGEESNHGSETYWGLNGIDDASYISTNKPCIFVGVKSSNPTSIGTTWHHETLDPDAFTPVNLYLAQLAYHSKDAPADRPLTLPPATAPYRLLAVDDAYVYRFDEDANYGLSTTVAIGGTRPSFVKFDLSGLGITNAACAKFKIKSPGSSKTPLGLQIWDVSDDSWNERTLTYSNMPMAGSVILSSNLYNSGWIELDLTSYVNSELAGDQIVSIKLTTGAPGGNKDASIWFPSAEGGNAAELVIHTNASTVAPPATPAGLVATPGDNLVNLDWDDNTEDDFASYNVYRSADSGSNYVIDAMGLITSDHEDCVVTNGSAYNYLVKAVDTAGTESSLGSEIFAIPAHPTNNPPAFISGLIIETNATAEVPYSATIADDASDPESDPMIFSKISGPEWLSVVNNGSLNGTPGLSDEGTNTFVVRLDAAGGSDTATLEIRVEISAAPEAPSGLAASASDGSVSLSWSANTEADLGSYSVYRATNSGNYGSALTNGLTSTNYVDHSVVNDTTYYYVVTAFDTNSNESAQSSEASATPSADGLADPGFDGSFTDVGGDTFTQTDSDKFNKWVCFFDAKQWSRRSTGGNPGGYADGAFSGNNYNRTLLQGITDNKSTTGKADLKFDLKLTDGGVGNGPLTVSVWGVETLSGASFSLSARAQAGTTQGDAAILGTQQFSATTTGWEEQTISNIDLGSGYDLIVVGFWSKTYASGQGDFVGIDNVVLASALKGYDFWAAGWGTNDIGSATNDFDNDGVNNLYEYGLDGNPTDGLAPTNLLTFTMSVSAFLYVHPQRSDDTNIIYRVETTTNLVAGAWTNEGYTVTGTNVTGGTLDFVTNEVDTVENEMFIRMKIEQQ